ncbi:hypothetical protein A2856_02840 [Candidatus Uhrbacteria bacterium RIFCSPHIGHO2_01_FULL_63_20]|uniref:Uncharacterized protein n=1 Tax=Candidatus Uhrbacteria bacterium RIFCSPHIGHO2_01_FULL_63_20 TaxID=1802385 RepID=A0A1F7TKQ3_9BACT|nr:MAG: hypothetical protein A2856_02840 [Candidatus Uhrbacteria bacterium RIFCSPHIGHO2_01_FULL_63_20]
MVATTSVVDPRISRYRTTSNPPPGLSKVLKAIGKQVRRKGRGELVGLSKDEVRVIAKHTDREYDLPGRSDDLVRFLENTGALVADPSDDDLFFFDEARSAHVEDCCENGRQPYTPSGTNADRIEMLREKAKEQMQSREGDAFDEQTGPLAVRAPSAPTPPPFAIPTSEQIAATAPTGLKPLLQRLLREEADARDRANKELERSAAAAEAAEQVKKILDGRCEAMIAELSAKKAEADRLLAEADRVQREADELQKKVDQLA